MVTMKDTLEDEIMKVWNLEDIIKDTLVKEAKEKGVENE